MTNKKQQEFSRFENQYIFNLVFHARQGMLENKKNGLDEIDPNIDFYIETLESIGKKAGENMKAYGKEK